LFLLLYIALSFLFLYRFTETLPTGGDPIAINKYIKLLIPKMYNVYISKIAVSLPIPTQETGIKHKNFVFCISIYIYIYTHIIYTWNGTTNFNVDLRKSWYYKQSVNNFESERWNSLLFANNNV